MDKPSVPVLPLPWVDKMQSVDRSQRTVKPIRTYSIMRRDATGIHPSFDRYMHAALTRKLHKNSS